MPAEVTDCIFLKKLLRKNKILQIPIQSRIIIFSNTLNKLDDLKKRLE